MQKLQYFAIALITMFLSVNYSNSQTTICLGNDITVCIGQSVTIQDCTPGSVGGLSVSSPTLVNLSDDSYSGVVPIGFTFDFYGTPRTQCVIGSNGLITFNLAKANAYCPWSLGGVAPLPNAAFNDARDAIMPAYHDINPAASPGGQIYYKTLGTAPNRRFIVVWANIYAYGGGGECTYMACILNETANSFECHLGYKPIAPGWNGGLAIQGSENAAGTVAHITPGRNNSQWSAINEAKIWTPTSPAVTTNYTISNIPYLFILNGTGTWVWKQVGTGTTYPYNSGNLTVTATGTPTAYTLSMQASSCSNSVGGGSDTTWVTGTSSSVTATAVDDTCSAYLGSVTATPTSGTAPFTYSWPGLGGATTPTVTGVTAGTYTVQMTDSLGCTSTANVTVGNTPAAYQGSTTLVSCPGGNNGTAFAEMVPPIGTVSYQWDDPAMQTTQTAVGLTAGTYTCTISSTVGCNGTVTVTVSEIPGMIGTIANQTDVTCNSGDDGMININVVQGTAPYSYSWDNSTSTTNIADDLSAGTHTCTITDANGCVITVTTVINEPAPLDITFLTPDTQICPEDEITLTVNGTGGSSPYTYTWYEGGTMIGTGTSITVDPSVTNTTYCVELSEDCGSPTDQECVLITFPTPIEPSAIPDEYEKCVPNGFEFTNTSTNGGEIASTLWHFGDHPDHFALEAGNDSTSHYYPEVGVYTITMTVTSIYGCVYSDTLVDLIEVLPSPTAGFAFSPNPATIFETTVHMQDKSSSDVVNWYWYAPDANPPTSNLSHPMFTFPDGETGYYPVTLIVETERGCLDSLTLYVDVIEDILFYAPNTFTPDGDEFNQVWLPIISGIDIYDYEMLIFNRWGEVIWESHDPSIGWDGTYNGKKAPTGSYVWKAKVKDPHKDHRQFFTGTVTILK